MKRVLQWFVSVVLITSGAFAMSEVSKPERTKVHAEYGVPVAYQARSELVFPDFSVVYLGREDRTPKFTTATRWVDSFRVQSPKSAAQTLEVSSGQLPWPPLEFNVNGEIYTLYLHELPAYAPKGATLRGPAGEERLAIFKGSKEGK